MIWIANIFFLKRSRIRGKWTSFGCCPLNRHFCFIFVEILTVITFNVGNINSFVKIAVNEPVKGRVFKDIKQNINNFTTTKARFFSVNLSITYHGIYCIIGVRVSVFHFLKLRIRVQVLTRIHNNTDESLRIHTY